MAVKKRKRRKPKLYSKLDRVLDGAGSPACEGGTHPPPDRRCPVKLGKVLDGAGSPAAKAKRIRRMMRGCNSIEWLLAR